MQILWIIFRTHQTFSRQTRILNHNLQRYIWEKATKVAHGLYVMQWLSRLVRSRISTVVAITSALRTGRIASSPRENSKQPQPQLPIRPPPLWLRLCPPIFLENTSYHVKNKTSMEVTRDDFEKDDSQLLKDIVMAIETAQFGNHRSSHPSLAN